MHFKNFHFFITFWQKIGIFFLMCILAGYHCTSIISWQYFENDILLILTWVLNQGPWYFKADALSTRPTEHGKVDESSTDKTETFVYSFRPEIISAAKIAQTLLLCVTHFYGTFNISPHRKNYYFLIPAQVLNQGPRYPYSDALSTRPSEHTCVCFLNTSLY